MKRLGLSIILSLLASAACVGDSPDFAWGASLPAAVKEQLRLAGGKWRDAAAVPKSPESLKSSKNKSFDESYMREILGREDFAYDLLDVAMTKLKRIDECRDLYAKAVSAAGSKAPEAANTFDRPYYLLKSKIRLAIGISRAAISREMAAKNAVPGADTSSYCFQAMESAIDALRDAAIDADKAPNGKARADQIRKFRAGLFEVWETAERAKDTKLIGGIDLIKVWNDSGLTKHAGKK